MSNSQYEYLVNALDAAPSFISEIEIEKMLPEIDFLLSNSTYLVIPKKLTR